VIEKRMDFAQYCDASFAPDLGTLRTDFSFPAPPATATVTPTPGAEAACAAPFEEEKK
jgi:hypothetical protein